MATEYSSQHWKGTCHRYGILFISSHGEKQFESTPPEGRLFHQYAVDMYAKIEQQRLNYIALNQKIRVDLYSGLADAVAAGDTLSKDCGRKVVLPTSYTGSPRQMFELYQDAMSIVRKYGKPDLFITFTCNPQWEEITSALLLDQ